MTGKRQDNKNSDSKEQKTKRMGNWCPKLKTFQMSCWELHPTIFSFTFYSFFNARFKSTWNSIYPVATFYFRDSVSIWVQARNVFG